MPANHLETDYVNFQSGVSARQSISTRPLITTRHWRLIGRVDAQPRTRSDSALAFSVIQPTSFCFLLFFLAPRATASGLRALDYSACICSSVGRSWFRVLSPAVVRPGGTKAPRASAQRNSRGEVDPPADPRKSLNPSGTFVFLASHFVEQAVDPHNIQHGTPITRTEDGKGKAQSAGRPSWRPQGET